MTRNLYGGISFYKLGRFELLLLYHQTSKKKSVEKIFLCQQLDRERRLLTALAEMSQCGLFLPPQLNSGGEGGGIYQTADFDVH